MYVSGAHGNRVCHRVGCRLTRKQPWDDDPQLMPPSREAGPSPGSPTFARPSDSSGSLCIRRWWAPAHGHYTPEICSAVCIPLSGILPTTVLVIVESLRAASRRSPSLTI